jgi:hypothetical protein
MLFPGKCPQLEDGDEACLKPLPIPRRRERQREWQRLGQIAMVGADGLNPAARKVGVPSI